MNIYVGNLHFNLSEDELKEILEHFDGIAIESIMRQPVRLENIYVEVTRNLEN